jgi:UDP:flavonoid glycosyltransferase YjiC (YdhE family)
MAGFYLAPSCANGNAFRPRGTTAVRPLPAPIGYRPNRCENAAPVSWELPFRPNRCKNAAHVFWELDSESWPPTRGEPMRALFTCQPGLGHLHPMVPLARAFANAGHGVTFAVSPSFHGYVEAAGFPAVGVGLDWLESEMERTFPEVRSDIMQREGVERAWRLAFSRSARRLLPELIALVAATQPDVIVSESSEWSGPLAGEVCRVPHALLGIGASLPRSVLVGVYGEPWNRARARLGLPPDPDLVRVCPQLYLDAYPPSFQPLHVGDLAPKHYVLRPVPYQVGDVPQLPWLDELDGRPTAYVTMGTVFNRVADAIARVLDALAGEQLNVVATIGDNGNSACLRPGARVWIERYLPLAAILDRVDVVICHGGYNTVVAALVAGKPMLCLPLGADQHYNAFRVSASGAGLSLDVQKASPPAIRQAVGHLLGDPLFRQNAQRLARELAELPSVESATPLLEELARDGITARASQPSNRTDGR